MRITWFPGTHNHSCIDCWLNTLQSEDNTHSWCSSVIIPAFPLYPIRLLKLSLNPNRTTDHEPLDHLWPSNCWKINRLKSLMINEFKGFWWKVNSAAAAIILPQCYHMKMSHRSWRETSTDDKSIEWELLLNTEQIVKDGSPGRITS